MPKLVDSWAASALLKLAKLQAPATNGEPFLELARVARSRIKEISVAETAAAIKRGALLLDVRQRHEFVRGHIPHASHLARGTLEQEIEKRAPDPKSGNRDVLRRGKLLCALGGKSATNGLHKRQILGRRAPRLDRRWATDVA